MMKHEIVKVLFTISKRRDCKEFVHMIGRISAQCPKGNRPKPALNSSNSYLGIIDEIGKQVFKKKLPNDTEVILASLAPYRNDRVGIVVESTYN